MENRILFLETQRFKQSWLWIILLALNTVFISGFIKQVISGNQFGDKPVSNNGLMALTLLTLLFSVFLLHLRLETAIKPDGIYVRFFPLHRSFKFYSWENLSQSFVRQYNPIGEYGGWGLRGLGKNRAFNVSGNNGIQLVTKDGSRLLIGTNKPDEATETLKRLGHLTTT